MQEILVYFIVAAAAAYLGKMLLDAGAGRKSGCNGCGSNCASQSQNTLRSTPTATPLVQIELKNLNGHAKK